MLAGICPSARVSVTSVTQAWGWPARRQLGSSSACARAKNAATPTYAKAIRASSSHAGPGTPWRLATRSASAGAHSSASVHTLRATWCALSPRTLSACSLTVLPPEGGRWPPRSTVVLPVTLETMGSFRLSLSVPRPRMPPAAATAVRPHGSPAGPRCPWREGGRVRRYSPTAASSARRPPSR